MFKNYLKVILRNIIKHKTYSLINILGLAIGMALCLLVMVYVMDEMSFDRYHDKIDRIYRIAEVEDHNNDMVSYMKIGGGVTSKLITDYPQFIQDRVRLFAAGEVWTKVDDQRLREDRVFIVDSSFFDIFTFKFLKGSPDKALAEPNTLVITETMAGKYFGDKDPLGQQIIVDVPGAPLLKVTAVVEDTPANSHFHFNMLTPLSTIRNDQNAPAFETMYGNMFWSYILLKEGVTAEQVESVLPAFWEKHTSARDKEVVKSFFLQALPDIHLRSSTDPFTEIEPENTGNILYLFIFSAIAVLILIIACVNFMNLSTARSANRAREVGLRKVVGAGKQQLFWQFMGESIMTTLIALPIAMGVAQLLLPMFNNLARKSMAISYLNNPVLLPGMVLIVVIVGFLAGSYPALFLSSFRPVNVIKGSQGIRPGKGLLRRILVIGQFSISIAFVIGSLVVLKQMNYMRGTDLGFDKENVVVVPVLLPLPNNQRVSKMEFLKNEYQNHANVLSVSTATGVPSEIRGIVQGRPEGAPESDNKMMVRVGVDFEYAKTLDIGIKEGRDFSKEFATDLGQGFLINEAVVRELRLEEPVGSHLLLNNSKGTVIGVFDTLHWEPKRREIFPMVFNIVPQQNTKLVIRISAENVQETLAFMENKWNETISTRPFQYTFLDDMISDLYQAEISLANVVIYFTVLTIFIACLGLFGLALFMAEQKTKEIGIRKVLGSTVSGIVLLLSTQFSRLILIANILAWPLSYFVLRNWLRNFYYKVEMGFLPFLISAFVVLFIALSSTMFQAVKAALANPVDSLHYE